jgi:hypothetical protein
LTPSPRAIHFIKQDQVAWESRIQTHFPKGRCQYVKCQETPQSQDQQAQAEKEEKAEPPQKKDMAGVTPPSRAASAREIQEKGENGSHPFLFYYR